MKTYLLASFGVIFFSVLVTFIIPEGKLNKIIVFMVRVICIAVLLQPVTGLFDIPSQTSEEYCDYDYVSNVYSEWQSEQLKLHIEEKFEITCECFVEINYAEGAFEVAGVRVCTNRVEDQINEKIYAYLEECGYINITVNGEAD